GGRPRREPLRAPAPPTQPKIAGGVVSPPIADVPPRTPNATHARHRGGRVPASKLKLELARVLREEGYIASFEVERNEGVAGETLRIQFKTRPDRRRVISGLKRISRPGLRVYARKTEIPRVLGGLGIAILSTSQGVMSG